VLHATDGLRNAADWEGLTTIGMCYSERTVPVHRGFLCFVRSKHRVVPMDHGEADTRKPAKSSRRC
jgi:hypothetical protein